VSCQQPKLGSFHEEAIELFLEGGGRGLAGGQFAQNNFKDFYLHGPLVRIDAGDHCRVRIAATFGVRPVFPMTEIFALLVILGAAPMARKNAPGGREEGDNAY
jgi:hypothetical protein